MKTTAEGAPKDLDCINEEVESALLSGMTRTSSIILNQQIAAGQPRLRAPDPKFNRQIGRFAGKTYSTEGDLLSAGEYQNYINRVLPEPDDLERLRACTKDGDWVSSQTVH